MSSSEPPVVLLVEDDQELASLVQEYLQARGFRVHIETRGDTVEAWIRANRPDALVLDIGLPGIDGLSLCKILRPTYSGPIIMLTALDEEADEVLGLEVGADDYLCKPVRPRILLARLRSLLRRTDATHVPSEVIRVGELEIDQRNRWATYRKNTVELTAAEFDLLFLLASNAGTILSRPTLSASLRGVEHDSFDRSLDLRISRLRKKLEDNSRSPKLIKSVRGVGYVLVNTP